MYCQELSEHLGKIALESLPGVSVHQIFRWRQVFLRILVFWLHDHEK